MINIVQNLYVWFYLLICKVLLDNKLVNRQSATLRALMTALVEGKIDINMLKPYIEEQTYITPNNKVSKL